VSGRQDDPYPAAGVPETTAPPSAAARRAASRVARNTAGRAVADILGKLASLGLITVLAHEVGPAGVGVLVFALAWSELAVTPIDMGLDRYFLRRVAVDRAELDARFFNVLALKLARAVPILAASTVLLLLVEHDGTTRAAVVILSASLLLDGLSYTVFAAFNALERADLIAMSLMAQRLVSAGLGIALLLTGHGVVAVALSYAAGSTLAFAIAMLQLGRRVGLPARALPSAPRRDLNRRSLPFAAQELLSAGIARVDAVLLSALATQAVVGYYGAGYRLLEATLFISTALQGAFAAMFTYLDDTTDPTIGAVFERAIKLSVALLLPCAIVLTVLADPLVRLLFGDDFAPAVTPLRLLALTVMPLGLVMLSSSLISSRENPRILVVYFGFALAVNVALNVALIPSLDAEGAALAMLITYAGFGALMLRAAIRATGPVRAWHTLGAALVAGAATAAVALVLDDHLFVALPASAIAYAAVFSAVERRIAPADFEVVKSLIRSRLPSGPTATLPKTPTE
jgi:O-antigen/teichoic acid export membrane protein